MDRDTKIVVDPSPLLQPHEIEQANTPKFDGTVRPTTMNKITLQLVPMLCIGLMITVLDKINLGNVHLALVTPIVTYINGTNVTSIQPPLMTEMQFGWAGTAFSIGYISFDILSNMLLKRSSPRVHFSRICLVWAIVALCMSGVTDGVSFIVTRFFMGVSEAGFFSGVIYYLSTWSAPQDRVGILGNFYLAMTIGSCISGFFSYGLLLLDGVGDLRGWQWVFVIESIPSFILCIFLWFYLPDSPDTCTFLDSDEKAEVRAYLEPYTENRSLSDTIAVNHSFNVFKSWRVWIFGLVWLLLAVPRDILSLFLPALISQFGFNPLLSTLLTTPIYAANLMFIFAIGTSSTRFKEYQWHILFPVALSGVGWLLLSLNFSHVLAFKPIANYLVLMFIVTTSSSSLAVFWTWVSVELGWKFAALSVGIINSMGSMSGLIAPLMTTSIIVSTQSYGWVAGSGTIFTALAVTLGVLTKVFLVNWGPKYRSQVNLVTTKLHMARDKVEVSDDE